ncbi:MAG: hypothetical protein ACM3ZQ_02835 [Bacillota bacterium]
MLVARKAINVVPVSTPTPRPKTRLRQQPHVSTKLLLTVISITVVLAILVVSRYAKLAEMAFAIDESRAEYARLINECQMLKVSIAGATALDEVERRARALGFRPAADDQYVHLTHQGPSTATAAPKVAVH